MDKDFLIDYDELRDQNKLEDVEKRLSALPDFVMRDYYARAKKMYKKVFGPTIGFFFVSALISLVASFIPFIGSISRMFINPQLNAGFYFYYRDIDKQGESNFNAFFGGFRYYPQILGTAFMNGLIVIAPVIIVVIPLYMALGFVTSGPAGAIDFIEDLFGDLWWLLIPVGIIMMISGLFVSFSIPLVVLRKCSPTDAIKYSFRFVRQRFWQVFALFVIMVGINIGGFICLAIGVLFTVPYTNAMFYAAFEDQLGVELQS